MRIFSRFDAWAAKRLFHPPIIKTCQKLGCTQHSFANHVLIIAMMISFRSYFLEQRFVLSGIMAICMVIIVATTALLPNWESRGSGLWRAVSWLFLALVAAGAVVVGPSARGDDDLSSMVVWFLFLVIEYARTLDTIPPEETKDREEKLVKAESAAG